MGNKAIYGETDTMRYGTPVRATVYPEVGAALVAEAKRIKRSVAHVAGMLMQYWYEDVYLKAPHNKDELYRWKQRQAYREKTKAEANAANLPVDIG